MMKILLTLFVLLFSSSVFAEEELIGKKILCGYIDDSDIIRINGWLFSSEQKVIFYTYIPYSDSFTEREYYYDTSVSKIKTYTSSNKTKTFTLNIINRKNLNVSYYGQDSLLYKGDENCLVYNIPVNAKVTDGILIFEEVASDEIHKEHLLDFKASLIAEAKSKNKI